VFQHGDTQRMIEQDSVNTEQAENKPRKADAIEADNIRHIVD